MNRESSQQWFGLFARSYGLYWLANGIYQLLQSMAIHLNLLHLRSGFMMEDYLFGAFGSLILGLLLLCSTHFFVMLGYGSNSQAKPMNENANG